MIQVVPDMEKVNYDLSLQPYGEGRCYACNQTIYNIKPSPYVHNYVIDLLPQAVALFTKPDRQVKQKRGLLKTEHDRARKFYVTNVKMTGNAGYIPVKFYVVYNCKTDVHALGKLVLTLAPEVRFYGDSAYY